MFNRLRFVLLALLLSLIVSGQAMADMLPADQAATLAGITGASTLYFAIGGGILVVLAGFWGFKKVMGLVGGK
jgi:hypothetical protein